MHHAYNGVDTSGTDAQLKRIQQNASVSSIKDTVLHTKFGIGG